MTRMFLRMCIYIYICVCMHAEQYIHMSWHVPPPPKTLRGKTLRQNRCAYHQSYTEGSSIEGVLADPLSGPGSPCV